MKQYELCIKSHTEAPDYEAEVEAVDKNEASVKFAKMINKCVDIDGKLYCADWSPQDLLPYIGELQNNA